MRQQAQQAALALEQAAQRLRDGKDPGMAWNDSEDLGGEFFGEQEGTFALTVRTEIPRAARVRQKMFLAAFVAANAREASLETSTGKQLLHRAQRPQLRLEARFVSADIAVEVILKQAN